MFSIAQQLLDESAKVHDIPNIDGDLFDKEIDEHMPDEYESDDDNGLVSIVETEVSFDFNEYVNRFARADILKW